MTKIPQWNPCCILQTPPVQETLHLLVQQCRRRHIGCTGAGRDFTLDEENSTAMGGCCTKGPTGSLDDNYNMYQNYRDTLLDTAYFPISCPTDISSAEVTLWSMKMIVRLFHNSNKENFG